MKIPSLPTCHDLVRLVRPTQDATTQAVLEHLRRRPNPWGYQLARSLAPYAFAREVPLSALKRACDSAPMMQVGRDANWEVVQFIRDAGAGRNFQCHPMRDGRLQVRKDLSVRVAADFYIVEDRQVRIFWFQPRRAYSLDDKQLGMFGALLRTTLLRGDFADAGVELLDLSAPDNRHRNRVPRTLRLGDLPCVSDEEVTDAIQRVVRAYDAVCEMGINWGELRGRSRGKGKTTGQDDLSL